ncbi:proprotein convertase P-domain-containing protein [Streptomyces sp. NRRL S-1022]|uniref:proprotein convertase P-domain-containing protein n=1 Tax=Streptomyces sp. NRRL S-1022 TaxID=1463880 RepID=UPI0004BE6E0F|nr:proprotein convertase P-domain-containing protein [Streptomyces sp. NRRL S-1022]
MAGISGSDPKICLVAPDGRAYGLKETSASESGGTLTRTYSVDASASPANGTWKLQVADVYPDGIGTLDNWSLTF